MVSGRLLHLLYGFWLGLAANGLLGHYVTDVSDMGRQLRITEPWQAAENRPVPQTVNEHTNVATVLHAGFGLPSVTSAWLGPRMVLTFAFAILHPSTLKIPPLSPPPQ